MNTNDNIDPNTRKPHDLGQSLWVDNISREIRVNGTLARLAGRAESVEEMCFSLALEGAIATP